MSFLPYKHAKYAILVCDVLVQVKRNSDGATKESMDRCAYDEDNDGPSTYIYADGNFSCDCNRSILFGDSSNELECTTGKYSVRLLDPDTREIYYSDGEW